MLVRLAGPDDAEAVQRVAAEAFVTLRAVYRPGPEMRTNAGQLDQLIALDGDEAVGTVRFGIGDDRLRVIGLAVVPACRRRGVARALIEELVRIGRARGCRALALFTIVQTGNVPVFERLGFRSVSETPSVDAISVTGQPLTEAYMERDVAGR